MVDQALLVLRIGVLVLLYLFVWRIARTAIRDVRGAQESMIIRPGQGFDPLPVDDRPVPAIQDEPTPPGRLLVVAIGVVQPDRQLRRLPGLADRRSALV